MPGPIVSLLPSATEIVYALGLQHRLAAVTFECNEPPHARSTHRVVVGGADTSGMPVAEIDRMVRDRLAAGEDLYTLDEGALAEIDPALILSQDLCRVCAVPAGRIDDAVAHLGCAAEVVMLDPYSLDEVIESITTVASAAGVAESAIPVVADLRHRLAAVRDRVAGRPRPRVAVVEWVDPLFAGGHWIPDQVVAAGGEPVGGHPHARSQVGDWDELRALRPDVVLVAPCGFGLDAAVDQAAEVTARVPDAQVWALDGDAIVVRPGPRLVDGVEVMAHVLHPGGPAPADIDRLARRVRPTVAT